MSKEKIRGDPEKRSQENGLVSSGDSQLIAGDDLHQTSDKQTSIASVLVSAFSKVEHLYVRNSMVSHLRHIDDDLAERIAMGLALEKMPEAPEVAAPVQELEVSPALQAIGIIKDAITTQAKSQADQGDG
jgi:hypothetical protein